MCAVYKVRCGWGDADGEHYPLTLTLSLILSTERVLLSRNKRYCNQEDRDGTDITT